jgi:hypothetical protein
MNEINVVRNAALLRIVALALLVVVCPSCATLEPDRDIAEIVRRWATGKSIDIDDQIERLGGGAQTVRRVAVYLHARERSPEERFAALDIADLSQRDPPTNRLEVTTWRNQLVSLMLWAAQDEDRKIRFHAIHLLSDELGGDPRALDTLVNTIGNTNEWHQIRGEAVWGLELFPQSDVAMVTLIEALQVQPATDGTAERVDGEIRDRVVAALVEFDSAKVIDLVTPLLKHKRMEVREAAQRVVDIKRRKKVDRP